MSFQQEHLPQDRPATEREGYWLYSRKFFEDHWIYLLAILDGSRRFLLYARYAWRKRHEK